MAQGGPAFGGLFGFEAFSSSYILISVADKKQWSSCEAPLSSSREQVMG
jgi:hypothetical protein